MANCKQFVGLNVGGQAYSTTLETLQSYPDSTLGRMFSGNFQKRCEKDKAGNFLVDADGPLFRYVLGFLRHGRLSLPKGFTDLELLTSEAEFYQNRRLTEAVKRYQAADGDATRIHFHVGGKCFTELRGTLMENKRFVRSRLGRMVEAPCTVRFWEERYTIDKDAASFGYLWQYLQHGYLGRYGNANSGNRYEDLEQLKEDAPFYDVEGLQKEVQKRLCDIYGQ